MQMKYQTGDSGSWKDRRQGTQTIIIKYSYFCKYAKSENVILQLLIKKHSSNFLIFFIP